MLKVFVSSTSVDLKEYRSAVRDAIMMLNMHPVMMEHFPAMNADAVAACQQKVLECDLFVGIYAHRYGYIPLNETKSITEMEYDWAAEADLPRHIFVLSPAYPWPDEARDPDQADRLAAFKSRIGRERVWSEFTTPDSLAAKVTQSLVHDSERGSREERRRWRLTIGGIAVVLLALVVTAGVILAALSSQQRAVSNAAANATLTAQAVPTATPPPMPAGFNVIVAGFGVQQADGTVIQSREADNVSDIIYAALSEMPEISHRLGWREAGHILAADAGERRRQARALADQRNANVVIYGIARLDNFYLEFTPEFYISAQFTALEPELSGSESFGTTISVLVDTVNVTVGEEIQSRLAVIRSFLQGLALYLQGDFTAAREAFEAATAVQPRGMEVLYIFAGNAALREGDAARGLALYTAALRQRPTYARALGGRGLALFRLALAQPRLPADPTLELPREAACAASPDTGSPQLLGLWAEVCYREAVRSTDQPPEADVDVKLAFALGQLKLWQSDVGYSDAWDEAQTYFTQVVDLYAAADEARQARVRGQTAQAYASLGLIGLLTDGTNPEAVQQAIDRYTQAVDLLKADVNRDYNRHFIDSYTATIEKLRTSLANLSTR